MEVPSVVTGVKHFAAYIRESIRPLKVLSYSKPCVQAYSRLCHGHFSALARVSTFLSTLSSYNVTLQHIPEKENVSSDYSSCNPQSWFEDSCQICKFVYKTINSVVSSRFIDRHSIRLCFIAISQQGCLAFCSTRLPWFTQSIRPFEAQHKTIS